MPDNSKLPDGELQPTIEIAIDAGGNIQLETKGTKGKQCDLLAGALESSLGEVIRRIDKDNYYC